MRQAYGRDGYAVIGALLPPHFGSAISLYYRRLIAEGWLPRGDTQSDRYWAHDEPVTAFVQAQLSWLVSRIADIPSAATHVLRFRLIPGNDHA